ncbi:MAG: hypothetical protein FVQ83_05550 [Chloroflexi bacterium]|nr:hypothetical protein [Chloroflexota bacterium]
MITKRKSRNPKNSLTPVSDGELTRLRALLAKKQEYIAILELELFNTRAELNSFTQIYNSRIAPLQQTANKLRKMLFDALEEKRANQENGWPEFPDIFSNTNGRRKEADRAESSQQAWEQKQERRKHSPQEEQANHHDPKIEKQIRDLFRSLAKRFHPDLTADPYEKHLREEIMTKVNQAYTARDLDALLTLDKQPDINGKVDSLSRRQEIKSLKIELKRLDSVTAELEGTLRQIDLSPAMQLRLEVNMSRRSGRDLLSDMAADLELQIGDLEEHLVVFGVELETKGI